MRNQVIRLAIFLFKIILKFIYCIFKLFTIPQNKVLFCSRQSNEVSLDFMLIQDELRRRDMSMQYICICRNIGNGIGDYFKFMVAMVKSMYHLATAKVCVLDSYWPPVSLLKHRKSLTVVQIWHAIGKIKKSGHASLGAVSGRSTDLAKLLNMHANYDHIIAGAEFWNQFYCESFDVPEEMLLNYGLPRIDYLLNTADKNREKFFRENPQLKDKKIILYAPTFRRNMEAKWDQIIGKVDYDKFALIIKNHPSQRIYGQKPQGQVYYFDDWKTMDLMAVCDYVITDYSAIALEAAVLSKKTFYWTYDYDEYVANNGINIDLFDAAPGHIYSDVNQLIKAIEEDKYDMKVLSNYRKKYLPKDLGMSTKKICDLIMKSITEGK